MISKLAVTPVVLFFLFFVAFCTPGLASSLHPGKPILVASPNGKLKAELSATNGDLSYRVTVDGKQVIAPSRLGVLGDDVELGTRGDAWSGSTSPSERTISLLRGARGGGNSHGNR
jgi:hypothetical protein